MFDVAIVGAGPSGMGAGIYAAKRKLKTIIICKGISVAWEQSVVGLLDYKNLTKDFQIMLEKSADFVQFENKQEVIALEKNIVSFSIELKSGQIFYARNVIIASGYSEKNKEANTGFESLTFKDLSGKIKVDSQMATNIPGIFAVGGAISGSVDDVLINVAQGARAVLAIV